MNSPDRFVQGIYLIPIVQPCYQFTYTGNRLGILSVFERDCRSIFWHFEGWYRRVFASCLPLWNGSIFFSFDVWLLLTRANNTGNRGKKNCPVMADPILNRLMQMGLCARKNKIIYLILDWNEVLPSIGIVTFWSVLKVLRCRFCKVENLRWESILYLLRRKSRLDWQSGYSNNVIQAQ